MKTQAVSITTEDGLFIRVSSFGKKPREELVRRAIEELQKELPPTPTPEDTELVHGGYGA